MIVQTIKKIHSLRIKVKEENLCQICKKKLVYIYTHGKKTTIFFHFTFKIKKTKHLIKT